MSTLKLGLRLSIGKENIGGIFGLPVLIINTPGGAFQPLQHDEYIENDMVIGDEMKDAIYRKKLQILRNSDNASVEIYKAYQARKKFLIIATVEQLELQTLS